MLIRVDLYACMHTCIYVYMSVCICVYTYVYIYMDMFFDFVHMYLYIYVCLYLYIYIYIYLHMYIYIQLYMQTERKYNFFVTPPRPVSWLGSFNVHVQDFINQNHLRCRFPRLPECKAFQTQKSSNDGLGCRWYQFRCKPSPPVVLSRTEKCTQRITKRSGVTLS